LSGIDTQNIRLISKAISNIENDSALKEHLLLNLKKKYKSYRIGITGPPGSGKSTIVNHLIKCFREDNKKVAVLLVDPSSPFTKGSVLGDRIRVNQFHQDSNVYIRSIPSKDSTGGLSKNISQISDILESAKFDVILYETVGVGQVEIDVVKEVDTVLLTLVPESGDDIQMMKAGILEIADIYIINKYDRKDSDRLYFSLQNMLEINLDQMEWKPNIVKTIASKNKGIQELYKIVCKHYKYLGKTKSINKYNLRYSNTVDSLLAEKFKVKFWNDKNKKKLLNELNKDFKSQLTPYNFVKKILND
tara:strand:- start:6 stop:917 length:912 start_codon:yes stop_codon:yes gene_type:complete